MDILRKPAAFIRRNARTILTGCAIAGTFVVAVNSSKDALHANDVLLEYEMEHDGEEINRIELVKRVAPCYIPTALSVAATITAIVGSHVAASNRIAVMSSAYTMAQEAAHMYRDKVREIVGERKAAEIDKAVADEKVKELEPSKQPLVIGNGDILCMDALSGQPFYSTMEKIRKAMNDTNYELMSSMFVTLNEFYERVGIKPNKMGEYMGWNTDHMIDLIFSSTITEDGRPCLVMSFRNEPMTEFRRLH